MAIKFELVSTSFDGEILHGLYSTKQKPLGTVVHLHGTWGNFYANPFIKPLAEMYDNAGYNFLSINIVGHDETSIDENFERSIASIESWLNDLKLNHPLILQGHSLGALKILRLIKNKSLVIKETKAVVLLSPFDIISFYLGDLHDEVNIQKYNKITKMINEGKGTDIVPKEIFNLWSISVNSYYSAVREQGYLDIFNARNGSVVVNDLVDFRNRIFIALGSKDFASTPNTTIMKQLIDAQQLKNVTTVLIDEAPHNFAGYVDILAQRIKLWLG